MILILPGIFFTLSRTMLFFWILNVFCIFISLRKSELSNYNLLKNIFILSTFILFFIFLIEYISNSNLDIIVRALERIDSFKSISGDSSTDFRMMGHVRLIENMGNLGIGTFSDLNYHKFFEIDDPWLMKVNPHSYLVEYSFLFGYAGFLLIFSLFLMLLFLIIFKNDLPWPYKFLASFALIIIQAVPSSLLMSIYFLALFFTYIKLGSN